MFLRAVGGKRTIQYSSQFKILYQISFLNILRVLEIRSHLDAQHNHKTNLEKTAFLTVILKKCIITGGKRPSSKDPSPSPRLDMLSPGDFLFSSSFINLNDICIYFFSTDYPVSFFMFWPMIII